MADLISSNNLRSLGGFEKMAGTSFSDEPEKSFKRYASSFKAAEDSIPSSDPSPLEALLAREEGDEEGIQYNNEWPTTDKDFRPSYIVAAEKSVVPGVLFNGRALGDGLLAKLTK